MDGEMCISAFINKCKCMIVDDFCIFIHIIMKETRFTHNPYISLINIYTYKG